MKMTSLLICVLILGAIRSQGAEAPRPNPVTSFATEEVSLVGRVDVANLDLDGLGKRFLGSAVSRPPLLQSYEGLKKFMETLRRAGAKELFVLVDLTAMPGYPVLVIPAGEGVDAAAISAAITSRQGGLPVSFPTCETIRGAVVAGSAEAIATLRTAPKKSRADIAAALESSSASPLALAFTPSTVQRRAFEEAMPRLPDAIGGGPITSITRGLSWATLNLLTQPNPELHGIVQARDAESARAIALVLDAGLKSFAMAFRTNPKLGAASAAIAQVAPQQNQDRVNLKLDLAVTASLVTGLVSQAEEAANRTHCTNNLKVIALAMHNYHAEHNTFPPAFTANKEGKPLLSWRVLILPHLDQKALFDKFHLDEPWDSPHNKSLISQMPRVYWCPNGDPESLRTGRTTYLAPRGPKTIFSGSTPVKIQEITDGTSDTIFIVDVSDETAVVWTRPDDWQTAPNLNLKQILGHHTGGAQCGFADGSVRFLPASINPGTFLNLLTKDGGEVIDVNEF